MYPNVYEITTVESTAPEMIVHGLQVEEADKLQMALLRHIDVLMEMQSWI